LWWWWGGEGGGGRKEHVKNTCTMRGDKRKKKLKQKK
jgi:hypothetical protein